MSTRTVTNQEEFDKAIKDQINWINYMLEEEREDDARMRQGEPHTWSESWLFIAPALIISLVVLWFASQGAL